MSYQLIIDQSTSGTKLLVVEKGKVIERNDLFHQQIYQNSGWVEHNPLEIWNNVYQLLNKAIDKWGKENVKSISIANQRETILAWDKKTGRPLYNAIVWQDKRTSKIVEHLKKINQDKIIKDKTGLKLDTYFSGTKIKWLIDNISGLKNNPDLAIGTMDSWLIYQLTNKKIFATDATNACRTLLYNIHTKSWDKQLLDLFGVDSENLAEILPADSTFGTFIGIPIKGVLGDSQAALYGENLTNIGDVKVTLGTGCSILMNVGESCSFSSNKIMTTIAWDDKSGVTYALEGIIRSCGDSLNWLTKVFNLKNIPELANKALSTSVDNSNLFYIPSPQGLASPYWTDELPGVFWGTTLNTTQEDFGRAILEAIIFQIKLVLETMEKESGIYISHINVDGGISKNDILMKQLASLLKRPIHRASVEELSALGAMKIGQEYSQPLRDMETIHPDTKSIQMNKKYHQWSILLEKLIHI